MGSNPRRDEAIHQLDGVAERIRDVAVATQRGDIEGFDVLAETITAIVREIVTIAEIVQDDLAGRLEP